MRIVCCDRVGCGAREPMSRSTLGDYVLPEGWSRVRIANENFDYCVQHVSEWNHVKEVWAADDLAARHANNEVMTP